MRELNKIGEQLGRLTSVTAMTDVTGFGLLGHLLEICQGSEVAAQVNFNRIPLLHPAVEKYRRLGCIPGGGDRNFASYGHHISPLNEQQKQILCDPQTSGWLQSCSKPSRISPESLPTLMRSAKWSPKIMDAGSRLSEGHLASEMVYLMQITSYQANLVYSRNSQLKLGCALVTFMSEQDDKG